MTAITDLGLKRTPWHTIVIFTVAFWLSSSLILDLVIMPSLYATGMMSQAGFATAGYTIFWIFNRLELLCAALALTGVLVLRRTEIMSRLARPKVLVLSLLLLAIALIYTYFLTPEMSAVGMQLNLFDTTTEVPATMNQLHGSYWVLEAVKLLGCGAMLSWYYRD